MFALSCLGGGWRMSISCFVTRHRLGMGADFSWVCTFQVGVSDIGGPLIGSGVCSRLCCLPLCVVVR